MSENRTKGYTVSVEALLSHRKAVEMYLKDKGTHDVLLATFSSQLNSLAIYEPDQRIPIETVSKNIDVFASWLKEPNLGLKIAPYSSREQRRLAFFYTKEISLLDYFRILVRYICISTEVMRFEISVNKDVICCEMIPNSPATVSLHQAEGFFAAICDAIKFGHDITPEAVLFTHAMPSEDNAIYQSVLGVIPTFNQPFNRLYFSNVSKDSYSNGPTPSARSLQYIQSMEAVKRLEVGAESWKDRCRFLLRLMMFYGEPTKPVLSELLAVTPRTLQRQLEREGETFRNLLAELRRELAVEYLTDRRLTCEDVAFLLGYKDVGQFFRVFRTWYSMSPGQYRDSVK